MAKTRFIKNTVSFRDRRAAAEAQEKAEKEAIDELYARIFLHQFYKFGLMRNCKMPF